MCFELRKSIKRQIYFKMLKVIYLLNPISLTDFPLWGKLEFQYATEIVLHYESYSHNYSLSLYRNIPSLGLSQERPETIVIPVTSVGDVTETRKLILQNTLEDELKTYFRLISKERFEKAQEKAFEEMDYEECTEDQCIILIQEMLQVENVFICK